MQLASAPFMRPGFSGPSVPRGATLPEPDLRQVPCWKLGQCVTLPRHTLTHSCILPEQLVSSPMFNPSALTGSSSAHVFGSNFHTWVNPPPYFFLYNVAQLKVHVRWGEMPGFGLSTWRSSPSSLVLVPPGPFFGFHLRLCGLILCGLRVWNQDGKHSRRIRTEAEGWKQPTPGENDTSLWLSSTECDGSLKRAEEPGGK